MKPSVVLLPGLLLALAIPSVARADIAPPSGYVESCTVDNEQVPDKPCLLCGDAYHGDVDACEKKHAGAGYERRCRTSGASVWNEVWCKTSATPPASPVSPAPVTPGGPEVTPQTETAGSKTAAPSPAGGSGGGRGCSFVAGSEGVAGHGWLLAVLGLGLAASRRRSSWARSPTARR